MVRVGITETGGNSKITTAERTVIASDQFITALHTSEFHIFVGKQNGTVTVYDHNYGVLTHLISSHNDPDIMRHAVTKLKLSNGLLFVGHQSFCVSVWDATSQYEVTLVIYRLFPKCQYLYCYQGAYFLGVWRS